MTSKAMGLLCVEKRNHLVSVSLKLQYTKCSLHADKMVRSAMLRCAILLWSQNMIIWDLYLFTSQVLTSTILSTECVSDLSFAL